MSLLYLPEHTTWSRVTSCKPAYTHLSFIINELNLPRVGELNHCPNRHLELPASGVVQPHMVTLKKPVNSEVGVSPSKSKFSRTAPDYCSGETYHLPSAKALSTGK